MKMKLMNRSAAQVKINAALSKFPLIPNNK
jgi:hypothetical protein